MGETLHKWGIEKKKKNIRKEILNENYCSIVKNKLSEIANSAKNLLLGHILDP